MTGNWKISTGFRSSQIAIQYTCNIEALQKCRKQDMQFPQRRFLVSEKGDTGKQSTKIFSNKKYVKRTIYWY